MNYSPLQSQAACDFVKHTNKKVLQMMAASISLNPGVYLFFGTWLV